MLDLLRDITNSSVFQGGANWWQWITSIVALSGWGMWFHTRFGVERCERKGVVPVGGTVHRHCQIHALEHGHTH